MPAIPEPLHGGLVTSRDASLLQPGEVSVAENVFAAPGSPALQKAPGRSVFGTALADIDGIGYCDFDTAGDKIAIVANGVYYTAPAGELGSFTSLTTGAGTTLDTISMLDKTVLFSGKNRNIVLLDDGTQRPQGLSPVTISPGAQHTATGGTWPLGDTSVPKYYEYWTTEVVKTLRDEVESNFEGTAITVNVTTITSHVLITAPDIVNSSATHWRLYRSNGKTNSTDVAFPVGFLIADVPIETRSFEDGIVLTAALTLPTAAETPTVDPIPNPHTQYYTYVVEAWNNPSNALADDSALATSSSLTRAAATPEPQTIDVSMLIVKNFGFTGIGSPITNIQVQIEGSKTADCYLGAALSWDAGVTYTRFISVPLTTANSTVVIDSLWPPVGSTQGRVWSGADFTDTNFRVMLRATGAVAGAATASIDFIKVAISHSGTTASQTDLFPSLVLFVGNERISIGSNGVPPTATTADLFQGSILMNDINNPTNVAWTIPGTIDYVPVLYRMTIDDRVVCIRALGTSALIGGGGTVTRMNFLPVAEDPEFNTGRAQDLLDSDDGIVSNRAAVRFVLDGKLLLFYVGQTSLKMTDAFDTNTATDDIIWTNLVNQSFVNKCFVENNAKNREILVFYPAAGSSTVNKTLRLSYDSTHIKNGKLKVISITDYGPSSATAGVLPSGERMLFTAKGATVYVENRGFTDASGGSIIPRIQTREMHAAGLGKGWELTKLGVHHQGGGGVLRTSTTTALANNLPVTTDPQTTVMEVRREDIIDTSVSGDGINIKLEGDDDGLPWNIDYLVLYAAEQGDSAPLTR